MNKNAKNKRMSGLKQNFYFYRLVVKLTIDVKLKKKCIKTTAYHDFFFLKTSSCNGPFICHTFPAVVLRV